MTLEEYARRLAELIDAGNRLGMVAVAKDTPEGDVWLMVGYRHPDGPDDRDVFAGDITP